MPDPHTSDAHPFCRAVVDEYYDGPVSGFAQMRGSTDYVYFEQLYDDYAGGPRYYTCFLLPQRSFEEVWKEFCRHESPTGWFWIPLWNAKGAERSDLEGALKRAKAAHGPPLMLLVASNLQKEESPLRSINIANPILG